MTNKEIYNRICGIFGGFEVVYVYDKNINKRYAYIYQPGGKPNIEISMGIIQMMVGRKYLEKSGGNLYTGESTYILCKSTIIDDLKDGKAEPLEIVELLKKTHRKLTIDKLLDE